MKVPHAWIGSLVDLHGQHATELARTLTLLGLEAEIGEGLACTFSGVIAASVTAVTPRDPGSLLTLNDGSRDYTVYSTAPGIAMGQVVAFAPPGAIVAGEAIHATPFGDLMSQGMVCSAQELGIGRESRDLLELFGVAPGTDLAALLFVDTPIAVEYPSNRGDVLSLGGIGRELAAHFRTAWPQFEILEPGEKVWGLEPHDVEQAGVRITIHDLDLCPRYAARQFSGVTIDDSPWPILSRLISLGLKPINNLVDITNIVLMELGQPLHPFDLDRIAEHHVLVRRAEAGEPFTTLDGVARKLTIHDLLIADPRGGIALAGVMGGKQSEVTWDTTNVLLESARFDKVAVRRTARRQGLRTDASLRFERGVDPALVEEALDRVAWYVDHYQIGQVEPAMLSAGVPDPIARSLAADIDRIGTFLGADIPVESAIGILERLGFTVTRNESSHELITIPSWRADVSIAEDLAEEVARHHSFNAIPAVLPTAPMKPEVRGPAERWRTTIKHDLAAMGYRELLTYPLGSDRVGTVPNPLHDHATAITLANALSSEQSVLRTSLLPGFLDAQRQNVRNRGALPLSMEINTVYWRDGENFYEAEELALMIAAEPGPRADETVFRQLKGTLETLVAQLHGEWQFSVLDAMVAPFAAGHVGQWAVSQGPAQGHRGYLGVLDPALCDRWDLPLVIAYAHIPWEPIWQMAESAVSRTKFVPLAKFPTVSRDLAVVVPEAIRYGALEATIKAHGGPYLTKVGLFDIFRGKQVAKDHKSLAFSLQFRNPEVTLTDEEVATAMEQIVGAVRREHGAELRT
ncbi:MAG: phenylalanine--tRNA ligase subunit beta [bacterium]